MVNDQVDGGLSLSDTLFLNKLNENGLMHPKEEDGSSSSASGMVSNTCEFNLSEGITALLQVQKVMILNYRSVQIASDADLAFSFNSRSRAEYCFSSNQRAVSFHASIQITTTFRVVLLPSPIWAQRFA